MVKSKEQKVNPSTPSMLLRTGALRTGRESFDKLRTGRKKVKVRLCCIVTCQRTRG